MEDGLDFAVKYPFTPSAKAFIDGVELNAGIVALAMERIKRALRGEGAAKIILHSQEKKDEIASFAAARMIVGHLRNNYITNRFAVNESKIARGYLDKDSETKLDLVAEALGIKSRPAGDVKGNRFLIDIPTYLRCSPRSVEYKIINRRIVRGMVEINSQEKRRLMEEAIKKHVESIPLVKDPPDIIKEAGKILLVELPKNESKIVVKEGDHPPCIVKLLEEMKRHTNLPHQARVYLATYLIAIGMKDEEIIKMFSNLPDFSEKVTSYQVNHLRKKGYSVPSCATVMSYGLCCATCNIGHPLRWHELEDGRKKALSEGNIKTEESK